jgi:hypothetical protein
MNPSVRTRSGITPGGMRYSISKSPKGSVSSGVRKTPIGFQKVDKVKTNTPKGIKVDTYETNYGRNKFGDQTAQRKRTTIEPGQKPRIFRQDQTSDKRFASPRSVIERDRQGFESIRRNSLKQNKIYGSLLSN